MHFRNHQEYLRFFSSTPVEPKEYVEEKAVEVPAEPETAPENTEVVTEEAPKRRRRKDG